MTIDLAVYHVDMVTQICDCLGIRCFSVQPERATLIRGGKLIQEKATVLQNGKLLPEKEAVVQNGYKWKPSTTESNGRLGGEY